MAGHVAVKAVDEQQGACAADPQWCCKMHGDDISVASSQEVEDFADRAAPSREEAAQRDAAFARVQAACHAAHLCGPPSCMLWRLHVPGMRRAMQERTLLRLAACQHLDFM